MKIETKKLEKSEVELTIELSLEEMEKFVNKAVASLSEKKEIPGFRKGKAPRDVVEKSFGEMAVWQEAAYLAIEKTVWQAVDQEKLYTVGQPKVDLEKLAPGNPLVYKAVVALIPAVTIGDYSKISVKQDEVTIDAEKIDQTIQSLLKMRASEKLVDRVAKEGDKVEIDFEVKLDGVTIENGSGKKYPLTLGEKVMIPGFEEAIVGMKAGEKKTFPVTFPKEYPNEQVAGKECSVDCEVRGVYELEMPKIDETFLKSLGGNFKDEKELRQKIEENIKHEEMHKAMQKAEIDMFDKLVEVCTFDDIPDILIQNEVHKMEHELESNLAQRGIKLDDYLAQMGKTAGDLKLDFAPDAMKRVKVALMNKQIGKDENITITDEDFNKEIEKLKTMYKENAEAMKNIEDPRYQEFIRSSMINDKVVAFLKEKIIKK